MCASARVCVCACVTLAPFSSLWPAFTLTVHINALYNESVYRQEQHTTYDSVKIATLLPFEIFEGDNCLFVYEIGLIAIREVSPPFGEEPCTAFEQGLSFILFSS